MVSGMQLYDKIQWIFDIELIVLEDDYEKMPVLHVVLSLLRSLIWPNHDRTRLAVPSPAIDEQEKEVRTEM